MTVDELKAYHGELTKLKDTINASLAEFVRKCEGIVEAKLYVHSKVENAAEQVKSAYAEIDAKLRKRIADEVLK